MPQNERHKIATTLSEARALGASRSMIEYDVDNGYAVVHDQPAVVLLGRAATCAPLVEAWRAEDSELGKVGELRGRRVIRYVHGSRRLVQPEHNQAYPGRHPLEERRSFAW